MLPSVYTSAPLPVDLRSTAYIPGFSRRPALPSLPQWGLWWDRAPPTPLLGLQSHLPPRASSRCLWLVSGDTPGFSCSPHGLLRAWGLPQEASWAQSPLPIPKVVSTLKAQRWYPFPAPSPSLRAVNSRCSIWMWTIHRKSEWEWKSLSCVWLFATPWTVNFPGQNSGVNSLSLLHRIFPTQGSNPGLLHFRQILYQLSHKGRSEGCSVKAYGRASGYSSRALTLFCSFPFSGRRAGRTSVWLVGCLLWKMVISTQTSGSAKSNGP